MIKENSTSDILRTLLSFYEYGYATNPEIKNSLIKCLSDWDDTYLKQFYNNLEEFKEVN